MISGNPLDVDPQDHRALDGLSEAYLGMQRNEEAAEHALEAVGLFHHLPSGHFHLGIASPDQTRYPTLSACGPDFR